jgi:cytoskeletal protein CcmA (bactofilin family)
MLKKSRKVVANSAIPADPVSRPDKTVIGEQINIEGTIRGEEDLLIEGSVKGNIVVKAHHLTVGPKGKVEAEIEAANITISGRVMGNIKASGKVEITKAADFKGEIKSRSISIEDGAYLKAMIELDREPMKKVPQVDKPGGAAPAGPAKEPLILAGKGNK